MMNLTGKKIFVTGGSRGIGAGIVKKLSDLGAQVAFTYSTNEAKAQELLKSLKGDGHLCFQLDISNTEAVENTVAQLYSQWTQVDGVVNNAGITKDQLLLRMKTEDFTQVIQTNLTGAFAVTKAFSKHMLKARKGSFVNISSVIGSTGNAGQTNYAASKGGLESFTKSVALELASRGIRANCIAPGYIKSDMTDALTEDQLKAMTEKIPLQRAGEPSEIASAVAFLLSDEASYITGQTLHVNGGMY
ncbi:3-oxoacyl-(Acyl-carrier-protein) reductase [Pseudobdellovibrio exovorus JSS]|uniref:3-oxoacyl-[acyl-carrier-protein] reductase n=2 Tax=Pseudobdellovibrio exovorus TaxID=453816 RepID=M4V8L4_9BACT|nr:3-oxoacyl-[acyl-carrier-protein] reductase [Pseudobdellovibrio exovorus]AGH95538.1 3-oxoacyl-(Acyl-carrier-protein) reductase [Pseudobdellovibrio exovorus JSS]